MNLEEVIFSRRSIRKFTDEPISKTAIEHLISLAGQAPSASNSQPWKFLVVQDQKMIKSMHQAVLEEKKILEENISENFKGSFREYGKFFLHFVDAPVVIVPIYKKMEVLSHYFSDSPDTNLDDIHFLEAQSAVISVSLAIQNLLLGAHNIGIGASCMTGPLIGNKKLRKILSISKRWTISVFIALGHPAETPSPPTKKKYNQIIKWI